MRVKYGTIHYLVCGMYTNHCHFKHHAMVALAIHALCELGNLIVDVSRLANRRHFARSPRWGPSAKLSEQNAANDVLQFNTIIHEIQGTHNDNTT